VARSCGLLAVAHGGYKRTITAETVSLPARLSNFCLVEAN
jgi:hypothetical protein